MNVDPVLIRKELGYLILYLLISIPVLILYLWISRKARKEWLILIGQLKPKDTYEWNRRRYVRLDTVFPVEYRKMDGEKLGPLHEAFTKNVSRTGMLIEVKALHGRRLERIVPNETKLKLTINMPLYSQPVEAVGTVKWIQKLEEMPVDKYIMGVSYDDISKNDASRIIKYALWRYRRPVFLITAIALLILVVAALSTFLLNIRDTRHQLQEKVDTISRERKILVNRVRESEFEKTRLRKELQNVLEDEKAIVSDEEEAGRIEEKRASERTEEIERELEDILREREEIEETFEELEEDFYPETEEESIEITEDEPEAPEEPLITEKMIEGEAALYRRVRDYILKENIQLLDRFCYQHRTSIYHAASLFALAELRYKHRHDWVTIERTYEEVIKQYPKSKYATYASHRLDQAKRRLAYGTYTLRYLYMTYNLPPLFDYREIEPYLE